MNSDSREIPPPYSGLCRATLYGWQTSETYENLFFSNGSRIGPIQANIGGYEIF